MPLHDFPALLPGTVVVLFPRLDDGVPTSTPYAKSVTLASLALSQIPNDVTGRATTKYMHSTATAVSTSMGTPSNDAELTTLAQRMATDWYLWQLGRNFQRLRGVMPYELNGLTDHVEWSFSADEWLTTVRRAQYDLESEYYAASTTGGSLTVCCGGSIYYDGDTVIINEGFTVTGDTIIFGDTTSTITLTGDSITVGDQTNTELTTIYGDTITLTSDTITTVGGPTVNLGDNTTTTIIELGGDKTTTITIGDSTVTTETSIVSETVIIGDTTDTTATTIHGETISIGTDSTSTTTNLLIGYENIAVGTIYLNEANFTNLNITGLTSYGSTTITSTAPEGELKLPSLTVSGPPTYTGSLGEVITDGSNIYINDGSGWNTIGGGTGTVTGGDNHLAVFKIPESLWTAAATSETITLNADIGNSVYVERLYFRVPTAYSGGGISTFTITLEITDGTTSVFSSGVSGHTASSDYQVGSPSPVDGIFAFGTAVQVKASAASVGGNVADATAGDVWFVIDYKTLTES